ncbi:MAG: hypothetical protein AAF514_16585 [Verrucomicrobiota bacterium]
MRSLLSVSLTHFLLNELSKTKTQRRGENEIKVPIQSDELADSASLHPDVTFDLLRARNIMNLASRQLEQFYQLPGRAAFFDQLWPLIDHTGQSDAFEDAATELVIDEKRVAVELFRLRQRFRQNLLIKSREQWLADGDEIRDEFDYLKQLVTRFPDG